MPFRSGSNTTLNLDITLPSLLAASSLATIVEELLKNLLAQRHQIPQTYQLLKREVQNLSSSSSALAHHEEDDELNPRRRVRLRQERLKREKLDTRFSSVAGSFVDQFEHLAEEMRMEISSHASLIQSVCFIFGATPVSPKEVYHVVFPETMLEDFEKAHDASTPEQKHTKRATLQLFRSMVMHPELFDLLGKPLRPSNVFVAIKKKLGKGESSTTSSGWIPKPEYANLHRGRVTEFRLHNRPSDVDGEKAKRKKKSSACRNLMFTNDLLETPARNAKEDVTPVFDTYTPIPMDLCTPFLARSRAATQSVPLLPSSVGEKESIPICVEMTETPCVKRTPWTQGRLSSTHGESNSHCTPLFERRSWTNEATPREDKCFEWFISSRAIKGFKDPRILK